MRGRLRPEERETTINFNESKESAHIFTYNKAWQKRLEQGLGLTPTMNNGFGGREYDIDKKRIPMPRAPKKLSPEARQRIGKRLTKGRQQKSILSARNHTVARKSDNKQRNKGKPIAALVR